MTLLAHAATLGISPTRILDADPLERQLLQEVVEEAHVVAQEERKELARLIINELGEALS